MYVLLFVHLSRCARIYQYVYSSMPMVLLCVHLCMGLCIFVCVFITLSINQYVSSMAILLYTPCICICTVLLLYTYYTRCTLCVQYTVLLYVLAGLEKAVAAVGVLLSTAVSQFACRLHYRRVKIHQQKSINVEVMSAFSVCRQTI